MSDIEEIYQDDYVTMTLERGGQLMRIVRSSVAYRDLAAMVESFEQAAARCRVIVRPGMSLLMDQRQARGRNDAGFEETLGRMRAQLLPLFSRRAALVQSSVGMLHISRLIKDDKLERMVSQDEEELLRYLGF